jgi:hypothetical protein
MMRPAMVRSGQGVTWSLLVIGGSLVGSCTTDACACEPALAVAIIYGRVTDAAGSPVSQAVIRTYSSSASDCHASQTDFGVIVTAEDGRYRMDLAQGQVQDSVCVLTFARAPEGSEGLADSDTMLVVLDFRYGLPQDSARIDSPCHRADCLLPLGAPRPPKPPSPPRPPRPAWQAWAL